MKYFIRIVHADLYKLIHTKIFWVHVLVPVVGVLVAGGYILQTEWGEIEKIVTYVQMVAIVFPFMATVVVSMLFEADLTAGRFQNLLFVPCSKMLSHSGNLLALSLLGSVASVLAIVGFGAVINLTGLTPMPLFFYGIVGIYLFAANMAVYLLQYMICFHWGKSISMGVGITGTLLSAMLMFGMGDSLWKCCPYSYGIRCISYFLYSIFKTEISMYIVEENRAGICAVVTATAVLFVLFLIWSYRWQGTREKEE